MNEFQVQVLGSGSAAAAADRTVSVCLTGHVYTGACDTSWFDIVLPEGAASTVSYPPDSAFPGFGVLSYWTDASHPLPPNRDSYEHILDNALVSGNAMRWYSATPRNAGLYSFFDVSWEPGDRIGVPGSDPTCPANVCTIAQVQDGLNLTLAQNLGNFQGGQSIPYDGANFGVLLRKKTGTGSVSIDAVTARETTGLMSTNSPTGSEEDFSLAGVSVCVDRDGAPIAPCLTGYTMMLPTKASSMPLYLFIPHGNGGSVPDGEVRQLAGGVFPRGAECESGAPIDAANPNRFYCARGTSVYAGQYNYAAGTSCDYRNFQYRYDGQENPCVAYEELTAQPGKDLPSLIRAVRPSYDPAYDGNPYLCDVAGRYLLFLAMQGNANNNHFALIIRYDPSAGAVDQVLDTYTRYPSRFAGLHGCPVMESPEAISFLAVPSSNNGSHGRGAGNYELDIGSITGRVDTSLDPLVTVVAASGTPLRLTTATPHQMDHSDNRQIYLYNEGPIHTQSGYYAKVVDATHLDLYNDAAFTQPFSIPQTYVQQALATSGLIGGAGCTGDFTVGPLNEAGGSGATLAVSVSGGSVTSVTISAAGQGYQNDFIVPLTGSGCQGASVVVNAYRWPLITSFGQNCPAGLDPQWVALGATSDNPQCVTMTLPHEPVNKSPERGALSGVYRVNVLAGGRGYGTAPSVSIQGGGGTAATASAQVSGGAVTAIEVTNPGSGYSYPLVQFNGGGGGGASASVTVANGAIAGVKVGAAGAGYTAPPQVSVSGGGGSGATLSATLSATGSVVSIALTSEGANYTVAPEIFFSGGGGSGAAATAYLDPSLHSITSIFMTNGGSGYTSAPQVTLAGGDGTGAAAGAVTVGYGIASIDVVNGGTGYSIPTAVLNGGAGTGATATVGLYEELTAHPWPHNAASCGGDDTTPQCWSMPQVMSPGDSAGDTAQYYDHEKMILVAKTVLADGSIQATFLRHYLDSQCGGFFQNPPFYSHAAGWHPYMLPSGTCYPADLYYGLTGDGGVPRIEVSPFGGNCHGDTSDPDPSLGIAPTKIASCGDGTIKTRSGPIPAQIGGPVQQVIRTAVPFAGSPAALPENFIQTHPSARQHLAPAAEQGWLLDSRVLSAENGSTLQVFHQNWAPVPGTQRVYVTSDPALDRKRLPLAVWAGRHLLLDISGPDSRISDLDLWRYCVADFPGECVAGSAAGQVFAVVDKATLSGWCGGGELLNQPCAASVPAHFGYSVQQGFSIPDSKGLNWRKLTMGFAGYGRTDDGFTNTHSAPDGSWAIVPSHFTDGVRSEMFAAKLPPWPGLDGIDRTTFVPIPVQVTPVAGLTQALIVFGYAENGPPDAFYCTSRREVCSTGGEPFSWLSEAPAPQACAQGCTVNVPALSGRVLYFAIQWLDSHGADKLSSPIQAVAIP